MAPHRTAASPLPGVRPSLFLLAGLALAGFTAQAQTVSVSTWVSSASDLFGPEGVAADSAGNVYVATLDNTIRKIAPSGTVTTLAGTASQNGGFADGNGAAAQFAGPRGLAVDGNGNVYVADSENYAVRRIAPDGTVTTLAGKAANLANPTGVAVDPQGDVFVADAGTATIRKIAPDGTVSLWAGQPYATGFMDGAGPNARFNGPVGLAIDASGTLYVADRANHAIRTIDANGNVKTLATGITDPSAVVALGSGGLLVADEGDSVLVAVSASGAVSVAAGVTGSRGDVDGAGSAARLTTPCGLALRPDGSVAIADWEIDAVRLGAVNASANGGSAVPGPLPARLVNISTRGYVGNGQTLVAGFVVGGSGQKSILIRGVGPTLASYGVPSPLPQPSVTLFDQSSNVLLSASAWGGNPNVASTSTRVGAFPLPDTSADAAFVQTVQPGLYTAQVSADASESGISLVELYDADGASPTARLLNISTRAYVGTGSQTLVAGFVIGGSGSEKILIRGIGPTLSQYGVQGALPSTQLTIFDANANVIATQTGWSNDPNLPAVFSSVGAFPLPANSQDSAVEMTLQPGTYTVQLNGSAGATGIGLVELYEVPQ
jgi:streptogramin lyase